MNARLFLIATGAVLTLAQGAAQAADLYIRTTITFSGALQALAPGFEKATGDKVVMVAAGGQAPDLLILQKSTFEPFVKNGTVDAASLTDLATVQVGVAVVNGRPSDFSTPEKLKAALLAAKSVGVSAFASGEYVTKEVFPKLGIAEEMKAKTKTFRGPVGQSVATADVEIGFQQMSELLQIKALTTRRIPQVLQTVTTVTGGVTAGAKSAESARKFMAYIKSPAATAALKSMDMEAVK